MDFILFLFVPIAKLDGEEAGEKIKVRDLFTQKTFWIMMLCAGASEQAVSQWASAFAEKGLGLTKQLGDLLGPMLFAVCMGTSRTIYGKMGHRIDLKKFMDASVALCIGAYTVKHKIDN